MISATELTLIIIGFMAIIVGYLIPTGGRRGEELLEQAGRDVEEASRKLAGELRAQMRERLEDDAEEAYTKVRRGMERMTNEKMSAIEEYGDTVLDDIRKNHDEVVFMYDMLNDKHKNLNSLVSEVARKSEEAKQTVLDAELTAQDARHAAEEARRTHSARYEEADAGDSYVPYTPYTEEPAQEQAGYAAQRTGYVQEQTGYTAHAGRVQEQTGYAARTGHAQEQQEFAPLPASLPTVGADETNRILKEPQITLPQEQEAELSSILQQIPTYSRDSKVVPITSMTEGALAVRSAPKTGSREILEMYEQGKSSVVIARELGMGVGEVNLIIKLAGRHRRASI